MRSAAQRGLTAKKYGRRVVTRCRRAAECYRSVARHRCVRAHGNTPGRTGSRCAVVAVDDIDDGGVERAQRGVHLAERAAHVGGCAGRAALLKKRDDWPEMLLFPPPLANSEVTTERPVTALITMR